MPKKLHLRRETIQTLNAPGAGHAQGGAGGPGSLTFGTFCLTANCLTLGTFCPTHDCTLTFGTRCQSANCMTLGTYCPSHDCGVK